MGILPNKNTRIFEALNLQGLKSILKKFQSNEPPEEVDVFPILVRYEDDLEDTVVLTKDDLKDKGFKVVKIRLRGIS